MRSSGRNPDPLQLVDATQLDQLMKQAAAAPRQRSHLLLHSGPDDQVQRLLIAAQPGTYVRPHQHSFQWEMLVLLRGRLDLLTFDQAGEVLGRKSLVPADPVVQIAVSEWHAAVVRAPDTLVLEVKPGPYRANEFAAWAPEEGHEQATNLVHWMEEAQPGQKWEPTKS
jgi:cupin fold WbuC family metalloprotein